MQIFKRIAPIALLGALGLSTAAFAGGAVPAPHSVMPLSSGLYGEANIGVGWVSTKGDDIRRDDGLAGSFILGYKFAPYWAIDAGYTMMPHAYVHTWTTHLAVKGILPLGDGSWDVFAKAGGAIASGARLPNVNSTTNGVFYYGAGFTRWFQQDFGAILQGTGTTSNGNTPAMYTVTLGLTYFF